MQRLVSLLLLALLAWPLVAASQTTLSGSASTITVPNDPTTGTVNNRLAKLTATGAMLATAADTDKELFVVAGGGGTTGVAILQVAGSVPCIMTATASNLRGQAVVVGTGGGCLAVASSPSSGYIVGFMVDNSSTSGATPGAIVAAHPVNFSPGSGAGVGTVTQVAMTVPSLLTIAGSPITSSGTLALGLASQSANCVVAGPVSGGAAAPGCRALVAADLPAGTTGTCGGDLTGTYPACTVTKASTALALPGDTTPSALTGAINDYAPPNLATNIVLRVNGGASDRDWTGLAAQADGDIKLLQNIGTTNALVLRTESASSSAANRFALLDDVVLQPKETFAVIYDSTGTRWRPWSSALGQADRVRPCAMETGSKSSVASALPDDDDMTEVCGNWYGKPWKILGFVCKTNAGTVTATPILSAGTATSIVTTSVACGTNWTAGTINGSPTVQPFAANRITCGTPPCTLDMNITNAGGTAARLQWAVIGTIVP